MFSILLHVYVAGLVFLICQNYGFPLCQQFVCTFYVLYYFWCIMFDPWAKLENSVYTELCYPGKKSFNKMNK